MAVSNKSQNLGLYVRAGGGRCSILINNHLLYSEVKSGHTFSSGINFWLKGVNISVSVTFEPEGKVPSLELPQVEMFLHDGDRDVGIIVQMPVPTEPKDVVYERRSDQTVELVTVNYEVVLSSPPFREWISRPLPWQASKPSEVPEEIFELFGQIESAFVSGDLETLLQLAEPRIQFASAKLQLSPDSMRRKFTNDVNAVLSSDARIEECPDPKALLRLFPIRRGLVYRIEWASGLAAIHTESNALGFQQGFQVITANVGGKWVWIL